MCVLKGYGVNRIQLLLTCLLFCILHLSAQTPEAKTEHLFFKSCSRTDSNCVYEKVKQQVFAILKQKNSLLKDSLHVFLSFTINEYNKADLIKIRLDDQSEFAIKRMRQEIERVLTELSPFRVIRRERGPYPAWHTFIFSFKRKADSSWTFLDSEEAYNGGIIEKPPLFADCTRTDWESDISCFTESLQNHIADHYEYPEDTMAEGIEGRTMTSFVIDVHGRVINIRSSGTHPSFEAEGIRIISRLPRFIPGLRNGTAGEFRYDIPIVFRL